MYSEPTAYQNGRFLGAAEACWRIFHYRMHTEQPRIVRLQVHCEGQNTVCFNDGQLIENVAKRSPTTTLLEWFKRISQTLQLKPFFALNSLFSMCGIKSLSGGDAVRLRCHVANPESNTFLLLDACILHSHVRGRGGWFPLTAWTMLCVGDCLQVQHCTAHHTS